MKAVLIPVKDLGAAKQRLEPIFTQTERVEIAWLMLEHVFGEVSRARGAEKVFVVTSYEPAADLAGKLGMEVIPETTQISESRSVDYASRICRETGVTTLLRIPIDLPSSWRAMWKTFWLVRLRHLRRCWCLPGQATVPTLFCDPRRTYFPRISAETVLLYIFRRRGVSVRRPR